jgi:hypothetical protein
MATNNLLSFDNQLLKQLSSNNVNAFYRMQGWFLSCFSILKEIEMLNVVKKNYERLQSSVWKKQLKKETLYAGHCDAQLPRQLSGILRSGTIKSRAFFK